MADDTKGLIEKLKAHQAATDAADSPENEHRLTRLFAEKGMRVTKAPRRNPHRYTVTTPDGSSVGPVSLSDLEGLLAKLQGSGTAKDSGTVPPEGP